MQEHKESKPLTDCKHSKLRYSGIRTDIGKERSVDQNRVERQPSQLCRNTRSQSHLRSASCVIVGFERILEKNGQWIRTVWKGNHPNYAGTQGVKATYPLQTQQVAL